ncbi:hypothetical protein NC651_023282 [Populus alba x Populus x berolinensis]|nr:hypothetical protein NC651_023282 [Populus alba x Populus x berolinensis]
MKKLMTTYFLSALILNQYGRHCVTGSKSLGHLHHGEIFFNGLHRTTRRRRIWITL